MISNPEQAYINELPKLRQYDNIRTLGYVATNYTNKALDNVIGEIRQYNLWPTLMNNTNIRVDGIFFDEVPGLYHWQKHDYLKAAADEVMKNDNLGEKLISVLPIHLPVYPLAGAPGGWVLIRLAVHNPGTLPDPVWNYVDIANVTVIFEDTFANFIDKTKFNALKNFPAATNRTAANFALMVHSMGNIPDELVNWAAYQLRSMAGYNFATSVSTAGEFWHSFSSIFTTWVNRYAY